MSVGEYLLGQPFKRDGHLMNITMNIMIVIKVMGRRNQENSPDRLTGRLSA